MRQRTLRVFEVDDFNKLKSVVESKYELIKNYTFMLKTSDVNIQNYLREKNLNFFVLNSDEGFVGEREKVVVKVVEKEVVKEVFEKVKEELDVFDRVIRSGEEIESSGAIFLNKINPGAKVNIKGKAFIFGENRGSVFVEGDFLFVKKNRGNIVYNSEDIGDIDRDTIFFKDKRLEI